GVFVQPGNYSYYLEKRRERESRGKLASDAAAKVPSREPEAAAPKPDRSRKLSFKEQRELAGMEAAILAAETRVTELEATLRDPDFYATRAKEGPALIAALEVVKAEVARLYARWEELGQIGK
ncbi:MAG: ABC transporter C-terminal domain-containing protein, partial [Verrucomicrobia bacterium]|nr:ABC transporter C-terminal domain-containing protein [Verrucomicrobiota bacterium]